MHRLAPDLTTLHTRLLDWYAAASRPLPWRHPETSAWEVFLSEVMSQQTPVTRVEPIWRQWVERWPTPAALAAASPGEVVRAWARLGYPRRALRLHEAASAMVERHGGQVPSTVEELLALPGVGDYTAAAVACFAFGLPAPVIDTNVRRVLVRTLDGGAQAAPSLNRAERELALAAMPPETDAANVWNVATMELGALVCTARSPRCGECPVADLCAWQLAGRPAYDGPVRRTQSWEGTDRQARGALLSVLREASGPVTGERLAQAWPADQQRMRCLDSLVADGLVEPLQDGTHRLPA
ncbi:MAG: A/G-specific adenine glycosylase [Actinomycetota bacterium]|nr:A/G-specific adenine glycosylase [Actinomycetota bacterium]